MHFQVLSSFTHLSIFQVLLCFNYFFLSFSYNLCAFKFFTFHLHILQMLGFVTTLKKTVSLDNTVGVNLKLEILLTLLAITMNCLILMMTEQSKGVVK